MLIDTRQNFCRLQRSRRLKAGLSRGRTARFWLPFACVAHETAGKSLTRFAAQRGGTSFPLIIPLTAPPRGGVDSMASTNGFARGNFRLVNILDVNHWPMRSYMSLHMTRSAARTLKLWRAPNIAVAKPRVPSAHIEVVPIFRRIHTG
jgi:hypothetical protein